MQSVCERILKACFMLGKDPVRRLFYVARCVDDAEAVTRAALHQGIRRSRVHVLARDEAGLALHRIHAATPMQQLDLVHTGLRYAVLGMMGGFVLGSILYGTSAIGWMLLSIDGHALLGFTVLGTLFGAWEGGLVGLSREHYQIERYHDDVEAGRYLIMIDVLPDERPLIREMMNFDFPQVLYRGGTDRRVRLSVRPRVVHHQNTH